MAKSELSKEPIKVAIIGTGLAGLVTAYILASATFTREDGARVYFEPHLFEKQDALGMDSASVEVELEGGKKFRIDTPMRSIDSGSHARVWKLYSHLRIPLQVAEFSYSFSRLSTPSPSSSKSRLQTPTFIYEGASGLRFPPLSFPSSLSTLSSKLSYSLHMFLLALSYLHLTFLAFFYVWTRKTPNWVYFDESEGLGTWCERHWIWEGMRKEVLEPLVAAVATVGREEVRELPVGDVLEYLSSTFGTTNYVAASGVKVVVSALSAPLSPSQIHLSSTITSIAPLSSSSTYSITLQSSTSTSPLSFSSVILATQANQAVSLLRLFSPHLPTPTQQNRELSRIEALENFGYVKSLVVNHTDTSVLPSEKRDRRDLNLLATTTPTNTQLIDTKTNLTTPQHIQATHILSHTHPSLPPSLNLLQTTNPILPIDESSILSSTWFERAVVSRESKSALPSFILPDFDLSSLDSNLKSPTKGGPGEHQGLNGIFFCGSWCADGIPLLEGCVKSAERVCREIARREGATMVDLF